MVNSSSVNPFLTSKACAIGVLLWLIGILAFFFFLSIFLFGFCIIKLTGELETTRRRAELAEEREARGPAVAHDIEL